MSGAPQPLETLCNALEAILFVAGEPVAIEQLAKTLDQSEGEIRVALDVLSQQYSTRGLRVMLHEGQAQLTAAPECSSYIEAFLGISATAQLSRAALETLAIIAYRQPVTRSEIEAVRGVNSDGVLGTLQARGLVAEVGRRDAVGRPILYGVTMEFLEHFGFQSLNDLPELPPLPESGSGAA